MSDHIDVIGEVVIPYLKGETVETITKRIDFEGGEPWVRKHLRLYDVIDRVVRDPKTRDALRKRGFDPPYEGPAPTRRAL